jgi:hypothetical protein
MCEQLVLKKEKCKSMKQGMREREITIMEEKLPGYS